VYPVDYKTDKGELFWTMPKRPPVRIEYVGSDLQMKFIIACAKLRAEIFGIESEIKDFKN
jgi:hypothetical protein